VEAQPRGEHGCHLPLPTQASVDSPRGDRLDRCTCLFCVHAVHACMCEHVCVSVSAYVPVCSAIHSALAPSPHLLALHAASHSRITPKNMAPLARVSHPPLSPPPSHTADEDHVGSVASLGNQPEHGPSDQAKIFPHMPPRPRVAGRWARLLGGFRGRWQQGGSEWSSTRKSRWERGWARMRCSRSREGISRVEARCE